MSLRRARWTRRHRLGHTARGPMANPIRGGHRHGTRCPTLRCPLRRPLRTPRGEVPPRGHPRLDGRTTVPHMDYPPPPSSSPRPPRPPPKGTRGARLLGPPRPHGGRAGQSGRRQRPGPPHDGALLHGPRPRPRPSVLDGAPRGPRSPQPRTHGLLMLHTVGNAGCYDIPKRVQYALHVVPAERPGWP